MNFKKIALAVAAAAATTPAMAADLPVVAEPVNYVQTCNAYGNGYFKLPGQDTCIRVHGRIRTNYKTHDLTEGYDRKGNAYEAYAKGYMYLESMTETEFASIKTYTELTANWDDDSSSEVGMENVYLQLGFGNTSILIGRSGSVYSDFGGYSEIGTVGPASGGEDALQVSVTTSFGNGFTASLGVMDAFASGNKVDSLFELDENGDVTKVTFAQQASKAGNIEAAFGLTQGMFTANLSGAVHAFNDFEFGDASDAMLDGSGAENYIGKLTGDVEYGYAIAGTIEANVTDTVKFGFGASYAHNALSYTGGNQDLQLIESTDDAVKSYTFVAGVEAGLSDKLTAALDVAYSGFAQLDERANVTSVNGSLNYAPVAGLNLVLDAGWAKTNVDHDDDDMDTAKVSARVQYTF